MRHGGRSMRRSISTLAIRIIWGLLCLTFSILIASDVVSFVKEPFQYPLGTELGWCYRSPRNYIGSGLLLLGWGLAGTLSSVFCEHKHGRAALIGHFTATAAYIAYIFVKIINGSW